MPSEKQKLAQLQQGQTVVTNIQSTEDKNLLKYARIEDKYVYCGRNNNSMHGEWGNPYEIGKDGDRDEVCELHKANISPDRLMRIYQLKGKVLGCYCTPKRCHCDHLAELANSLE